MKEIQPGIYLATAADWIADQATWHESDKLKNFDFSSGEEYFLVCPDAACAQGYNTEEEAIEAVADLLDEVDY
jgi:hypothetical protein